MRSVLTNSSRISPASSAWTINQFHCLLYANSLLTHSSMSNEWLCRMPYRGSSLRGVLRAGVRNRLPRYASLSGVPSFYTQVDENIFDSSPHTAGPWSPEAQHGGPPSALMVRQIEQFEPRAGHRIARVGVRSEEHTSELQSRGQLVCRLLLETKIK